MRLVPLTFGRAASQTRAKLNGCLYATNGTEPKCQSALRRGWLRARPPDDPAGLGVDVDPDHPAVLHELHPVGSAVEFRPEIIGAAHERHDLALDLRQRQRAALLGLAERPVGVARRIGKRRRSG